MIPKKYSGDELRNKFCRPVRKIRNGGGAAISPETICRIVSVVRGHGFTIETEKCPRCGQSAYISRVSRDDLELVEEFDWYNSVLKLMNNVDEADQFSQFIPFIIKNCNQSYLIELAKQLANIVEHNISYEKTDLLLDNKTDLLKVMEEVRNNG